VAKITVDELKLFLPGIDLDHKLLERLCGLYTNVFKAAAAALRTYAAKLVSEGGVENVKADDFTLSGGDKNIDALLALADKYDAQGDALENGEGLVLVPMRGDDVFERAREFLGRYS
jgi:hypothetical protein